MNWRPALLLSLSLAAWPSLTTAAPDPTRELERAYLKELAFLKAEKSALEKRIGAIDAENAARVRTAEDAVNNLERDVLILRQRGSQLETRLSEADREQEKSGGLDVVRETLARGIESLERRGYPVPPAPAEGSGAGALVETARALIASASEGLVRASSVTRAPGAFFLADGTRVEGEVIHVGGIAAFGLSDRGSGALAPAGENQLRLWPEATDSSATALAQNETPRVLSLFLFESLDKEVVKKKEMTLEAEMAAGGSIAYVIAALGVLALFLVLWRIVILARVELGTQQVLNKLRGNARDSARLRSAFSNGRAPAARVVHAALNHLVHGQDRGALDDTVQEAMLHELPTIERFGALIVVIAAVAPLLGLLGTVTGMIATFDVITEFGTSDPRMLSGGISEALITTKYGLVVAIPALFVGAILNGRAERAIERIEHATLHVINAFDGQKSNLREGDKSERVASTKLVGSAG